MKFVVDLSLTCLLLLLLLSVPIRGQWMYQAPSPCLASKFICFKYPK